MKRTALLVSLSVVTLMAAACGPPAEDAAEAPARDVAEPSVDLSDAGSVTGTVTYAGESPDRQVDLAADAYCTEAHDEPVMTETVVVDEDGNLGNTFIYVKSGLEGAQFPVPDEAAVLDQEGCVYTPHVVGLMVGQDLIIRNSDPTLHNVNAQPRSNRPFNLGQPFQGAETTRTFNAAELSVPFKCDVHPWMSAWAHVVEHPYYAVSDRDGGFSIDQLPPGDYVLEAVHESLGTREADVTVPPNGTVEVNFDFSDEAA